MEQARSEGAATPPKPEVLAPSVLGGAPPAWDSRDDAFLNRIFATNPEIETTLGGHEHAARLPDLSSAGRQTLLATLLDWRTALEQQVAESSARALDARVLAASVELFRFVDEHLKTHQHDPDLSSPLLEVLAFHVRGQAEGETARFSSLARRLDAIGPTLRSGHAGVVSPTAELLARARDVLDAAPEFVRALVDAARQAQANQSISTALASEVERAAGTALVAFDEEQHFLTGVTPRPHQPMGSAAFDELLRLRGLDLTGAEVLELSRSVAEELRVEEGRVAHRAYPGESVDGAIALARRVAPISLGEAVSWMTELVRECREFLAHQRCAPLLAADREHVHVDAMPTAFGASGRSALLLAPQPLAPRAESVLLLGLPVGAQQDAKTELSVADLECLSASLSYPGGHLAHAWSARVTTAARRGAPLGAFAGAAGTWGTEMTQGWALASEELMREVQFRHSPASRLIMLRRALQTTLVGAVDVALAVGRMTPEGAAAFLVKRGGLRLPVARGLVRGVLRAPSSGLSAFVGKVRLEQLRREAHRQWRGAYSERRFHRLVLTSGPVPLAYLFERLGDPDVVHVEEGNGASAG